MYLKDLHQNKVKHLEVLLLTYCNVFTQKEYYVADELKLVDSPDNRLYDKYHIKLNNYTSALCVNLPAAKWLCQDSCIQIAKEKTWQWLIKIRDGMKRGWKKQMFIIYLRVADICIQNAFDSSSESVYRLYLQAAVNNKKRQFAFYECHYKCNVTHVYCMVSTVYCTLKMWWGSDYCRLA